MVIEGFGVFDQAKVQVEPKHSAARVTVRPTEKGVGGSYSQTFVTGAFAAGALAAGVLLAWKWPSPAGLNCFVRRIRGFVSVTTAFAQGDIALDVLRATATAGQYTGGANVTLLGKSGARTTRFTPSQMSGINGVASGNIAVANAAALAAPNPAWVFDSNPMGRLDGTLTTGLSTGIIYEATPQEEPFEIQPSEGFVIRGTWPATGVPTAGFIIDWDEIDPARYFGISA